MRNCFFSKYRNKLNNGCFNFPGTMVFFHCQETNEQQRQNKVPRCRKKTRKEIGDPQTAYSIQRTMFKGELAVSLYKLDVYIHIYMVVLQNSKNIFLYKVCIRNTQK